MNHTTTGLEQEKLPISSKFGFMTGCWAVMFSMMIPTFLSYFMTENLAIPIAQVSLMIMFVKIFDGFTDLVAGVIIDKTKSPAGKARPWFLRASIPYAICLALIFYVPASLSTVTKLVLVAILYALTVSIFGTLLGVAKYSLIPRMTSSTKERNKLAILGDGAGSLAAGILMTVTLPMVASLGWKLTFTIFAIIALICGLLCYFLTREADFDLSASEQESESGSIKDLFASLAKNKYAVLLLLYVLLQQIAQGALQIGGMYYFTYVLQNLDLYSTVMAISLLAGLVGMLISNFIAKRTGKLFGIACIIGTISYFVLFVSSTTNAVFVVFWIVIGMMAAMTMSSVSFGAMGASIVDYGEYKSGVRTDGLTSSVINISMKVGTAIGSAVVGIIMATGGFIEGGVEQTAEAVSSIKIAYLLIPTIFLCVAGALFFITYRLDKQHPQIMAELKKRRGEIAE